MQDKRYPLGILTIPWAIAGAILGIWTFAPLYIYHLSFAAEKHGWGQGTVGPQDISGYIGFISAGIMAVIVIASLAIAQRATFKLGLPNPKDLIWPFVISTLIFGIPYILVSLFYEYERFSLPYDGNWAAISGICSVGFCHFIVLSTLINKSQQVAERDTLTGTP